VIEDWSDDDGEPVVVPKIVNEEVKKKPYVLKKVNFVKASGNEVPETIFNSNNSDFVNNNFKSIKEHNTKPPQPRSVKRIVSSTVKPKVHDKQVKVMQPRVIQLNQPSCSSSSSSHAENVKSRQSSPTKPFKFVERRNCFNCGEKGHVIAHCPHVSQASTSKSKVLKYNPNARCYRCDMRGHENEDCPNIGVIEDNLPRHPPRDYEKLEREREIRIKKHKDKQIEKLLKSDQVSKPHVSKPLVFKPLPSTVNYVENSHILTMFPPPPRRVSEDTPSSSSTNVVSQDKYYHKKPFSKEQSWKPKTESANNVKSPNTDEGNGKWIEIIFKDDSGRPIASKAWVPH
jgi:hypothetical protein